MYKIQLQNWSSCMSYPKIVSKTITPAGTLDRSWQAPILASAPKLAHNVNQVFTKVLRTFSVIWHCTCENKEGGLFKLYCDILTLIFITQSTK